MRLSHGRLMDGFSFPLNNLMIFNTTVHLPQCEYKANKVGMEIMNHWFHHLQANSSWNQMHLALTQTGASWLSVCTCSERKSYLKVNLLKSRLVSARFPVTERCLNFIFTLTCGRTRVPFNERWKVNSGLTTELFTGLYGFFSCSSEWMESVSQHNKRGGNF